MKTFCNLPHTNIKVGISMIKTKQLWMLGGVIIAINLFFYIARLGGDTVLLYVSDLLPIVCACIAVVGLFMAVRSFRQMDFVKNAWMMILTGVVLYCLAEAIYAVLEIAMRADMNDTFPSVADYFWCIGYIPIFIGLTMMLLGYKRSGLPLGKTGVYAILLGLVVAVFGVTIYFILIPIIEDTGTGTFAKIFYIFYPVADTLVVAPSLLLMYITSLFGGGAISRPWKYLAVSFMFFTFADLLYSYLSWRDLYGNGNLIDVAWHSGYLLVALSGLYQKELIDSLSGGE